MVIMTGMFADQRAFKLRRQGGLTACSCRSAWKKAIAKFEFFCRQIPEPECALGSIETMWAACQIFAHQTPSVAALFYHHLQRTANIPLELQLRILTPALHAAICAAQLCKLPCGQQHLALDVSDTTVLASAAGALPQVWGLTVWNGLAMAPLNGSAMPMTCSMIITALYYALHL
jgi:hypothetical protein